LMSLGFGFEAKFSGKMVQGITGTSGAAYGFAAKNRLFINGKVSDATSFYLEQDLNTFGAAKYVYVDTQTSVGKFRLGTQRFLPSIWFNGLYQDSSFFAQTKLVATGLNYMAGSVGVGDLSVGFIGGYNAAAKKVTAQLANVVGSGATLYGTYADNNAGKSGFAVGAEMKIPLVVADAFVQGHYDLSDDAAVALGGTANGNTKARTFVAGGASMGLVGTPFTIYADALLAASDGSKTTFGNETEIKAGAKMPLNADATLGFEMTNTTGAGAANSWMVGAEIRI
ncbi:MAG: hypothetical protein AABZ14_01735, partial [Candidatus Margulisiibacteriota bacterium]